MSLYPPGTDASVREGEAELRCTGPDCEHVWWSPCTEHLGAMDLHEDTCPECGEPDPEILGVE